VLWTLAYCVLRLLIAVIISCANELHFIFTLTFILVCEIVVLSPRTADVPHGRYMKGQDIVLLLKINILRRRQAGSKDWICYHQKDSKYKLDWDPEFVGLFDDLKYRGLGDIYAKGEVYGKNANSFKEEWFDNSNLITKNQSLSFDKNYSDKYSSEYWSYQYSMRGLSEETGISKTEVNTALRRCFDVGLANLDRKGIPSVNTKALFEFIMYGIRYVFPARLGEITRGITTSFAAPVLEGKLISAGDLVPVWPSPHGTAKGQAVEPLFKTVPFAVRRDLELYAMLALVDSIRLGQARERKVASELLEHQLRVSRET
jgi:hypothetical protein